VVLHRRRSTDGDALRRASSYEAVGVLLRTYDVIDAPKVTTPPYYNTWTSARPRALKLGGRLLLHPWAVPVASYTYQYTGLWGSRGLESDF
jgi:hypothetical protein